MSPEGEWARLSATDIPGFAGFYFDDEMRLVVLTTLPSSRTAAEDYVRNLRQTAAAPFPAAEIEFRQATFDARQLRDWRALLYPLYPEGLFVSTDFDEVRNQLVIGVNPDVPLDSIVRRLLNLGIPRNAFIVEHQVYMRPDQSLHLRAPIRPVNGALQIQRQDNAACSIGFNTQHLDQRAFVTASHCSNTPFALDATGFNRFFQPNSASGGGYEVTDKAFFGGYWSYNGASGVCAPNHCRFSDSQVSRYEDSIPSNQGRISRPQAFAIGTAGTLAIDPSFPSWDVFNKLPLSFMTSGLPVDKIGRSSGWTRGQINGTCVDQVVAYPGIGERTLLCQWRATYYREGGDSGGPIILTAYSDPDALIVSSVHLLGTHVSGSSPTQALFSPVQNTEYDYQLTLKVCTWQQTC